MDRISIQKKAVLIPVDFVELPGELALPARPNGLVLFVHGSGSSRFSPRNQAVANYLNKAGTATLLFDLLTPEEDRDYGNRFNIALLKKRLLAACEWTQESAWCKQLPLALFGASTGAAAALMAAASVRRITSVVSRGGRPDLAMEALPFVQAPVLLLVGGVDTEVLHLNQKAFAELPGEKQLKIIPGASHLFEEKGAMDQVAAAASNWFTRHFHPVPQSPVKKNV